MQVDELLIKKFLDQEVFDIWEEEVEVFFSQFRQELVVNKLIEHLKGLTKHDINIDIEVPWKLGRCFGDIKPRYPFDTAIYLQLRQGSLMEKLVVVNFLEGFWDQTFADWQILFQLSKDIIDDIGNFNSSGLSATYIESAIGAFVIGYANNKFHSVNYDGDKIALKASLNLMRQFIVKHVPKSHYLDLLSQVNK